MKQIFSNPLTKAVALLLAAAMMIALLVFAGLNAREWLQSRSAQDSQEVVLEAPEPDEQDPGEDIEDPDELAASEDKTIQSDQPDNVVDEPDSSEDQQGDEPAQQQQTSTPATTQTVAVTKPQSTTVNAPAAITSSSTSNKSTSSSTSNKSTSSSTSNKSTSSSTSNKSSSSSTSGKTQVPLYQPSGAKPVDSTTAQQLVQSTAKAPTAQSNVRYSSARFSKKGTYSESKVYKDGYVDVGAVTISNKTFTGNLYIKVPSGTVTLKNVNVQGTLFVHSGSDWVKLYDVHASRLEVNSSDTSRVFASRDTELSNVDIKSEAILEEGGLFSNSRGFVNVTVNAPKGTTLTLKNLALNLLQTRSDCDVVYDDSTIINYIYTYSPTDLYGYGQVNRLYCYSDGVYYDAKPLYVQTGRGYATPAKRIYSSGSGSTNTDKAVTLYTIPNQYLDVGEKKIVGIDHDGSSLKVTTSNASVAKVTYSTAKSHITMTGAKPGRATIKVTSSRTGFASKTISFDIIVRDNSVKTVQLSGISDKYLDQGEVRYLTVNTNASSITLTNSNSRVAQVTVDGFQLKLKAVSAGTTTVKVTASRSGQTSKSTTFQIHVSGKSGTTDTVSIAAPANQILNRGAQRILNIRTDATGLKAVSSNPSVVKVSVRSDDTVLIEGLSSGTSRITLTGTRRGYTQKSVSFYVDVWGKNVAAPTVSLQLQGAGSYSSGSWTNRNVIVTLSGYSSDRAAFSYERPAGGTSSQWGTRRELSGGTLTISAEGQKDYYFFTHNSKGDSETTGIYTVRIDKTAPSLNIQSSTQNTLLFTAADALSGIRSVSLQDEKGSSYTPSLANGKYSFTPAAAGSYTVYVTDRAGNTAKAGPFALTGTAKPDTTPPVISITAPTNRDGWFKQPQQVTFTVTDESSVQQVLLDNLPLTAQSDGSYRFTASTEGNPASYQLVAIDQAGNRSQQNVTLYLDTTAPKITASYHSDTKTASVQLSDALSGVVAGSVQVSASDASAVSLTGSLDQGYTFAAKAGVRYTITAMDGAGNIESYQLDVPADPTPSQPPQGTITLNTPTVTPDGTAKSKTLSFSIEQELQPGETIAVTAQRGTDSPLNLSQTQSGNSTNCTAQLTENGSYTVVASIVRDGTVLMTQQKTVEVTGIDSTAPQLQITQNEGGTVAFTATDLNKVTATFDGKSVELTATPTSQGVTYSATLQDVQPGEHTLVLTDIAGNTTTQQVTVAQKQQAPTITIASPALTSTDGKTATATLTVDAHGQPVQVSAQESGATVTPSGENTYTFAATENGEYTVVAQGKEGLSDSVVLTVSGIQPKSNEPPVIELGQQQINEKMTAVTVPITVSDPDGSASAVKLTASGGSLSGSGSSYTFTATANGSYTFTATDAGGQQATAQLTVEQVIGSIAPSISASQQQLGAQAATAQVTVQTNGGAPIAAVTGSEGCTLTAQPDGSYLFSTNHNGSYTLTVTNTLGLSDSTTLQVTGIDSTPPVIGEPVLQYSDNRTSCTISVPVTDDQSLSSVTLAGTAMQQDASGYTLTVTDNASYTLTATDLAGNVSTKQIEVTGIDRTPPSIAFTSKNDSWQKNQIVTFSVTDANSGVQQVQVAKDGAPVSLTEGAGYQFTASANGTYTVTATDLAGNTASQSVIIRTVDAKAPKEPQLMSSDKAVPVYDEKTGQVYAAQSGSFSVSFQKAAEGESPVQVYVQLDGKEYTPLAADGKITLQEGEHSIKLKAVDAAGNESAAVLYKVAYKAAQPAAEGSGAE